MLPRSKFVVLGSLVLVVCLLIAGSCAQAQLAEGHDQNIALSSNGPVAATAVIGQGSGTLLAFDRGADLTVTTRTLGTYIDETTHHSAVFDFDLPKPIPLAASGDRFGLSVFCDRKTNVYPPPDLRILFRDADHIVWALNTRMQSLGTLAESDGFEQYETFPWNSNELGRITPWTLNHAYGKRDEIDPPKQPLQFVGFRLITHASQTCFVRIHDLRWIGADRSPNPYWLFTGEADWSSRSTGKAGEPLVWGSGPLSQSAGSRFGLGAGDAQPYVKASDIPLNSGGHRYAWEILRADGWRVAATGSGSLNYAGVYTPYLKIPLLPAGTYHLRLSIWPAPANEPEELYICYVVVRNGQATTAGTVRPTSSPLLSFISSTGSNIFKTGSPAVVHIRASSGEPIRWTLEDAEQTQIDAGVGSIGSPVAIDLEKYAAQTNAFWLKAEAIGPTGQVDAIARRTLGFESAPLPVSYASSGRPPALKPLSDANTIARTKCDWNEGSSPIISHAATLIPSFDRWMDDAAQDKYTTVELSAPWMEVEPLPGVYIWGPLDKLVDDARQRGLRVVFRIHPNPGCLPSWLPLEFQEDQNGSANGLWGGSSNLVESPASSSLQKGLYDYTFALAAHFRDRQVVAGYTLSNVFFDHGWLDMPYLNQYVDYSRAMQHAFAVYLGKMYGDDIQRLDRAYGQKYSSWNTVAPPVPEFSRDKAGRLKPDVRPIWRDWMAAKLNAMRQSKDEMSSGLRRGDPLCQVGYYADDALQYMAQDYVSKDDFVADGSMEMMFPPDLQPYKIRYEPIGKIARTATLVDVGMTNLLAYKPGWNTFNNYVFPDHTLADFSPAELEAERRLTQWFSVMDRLSGAQPVEAAKATTAKPAYLYSMESLFDIGQHTFSARNQDMARPYQFQIGAEKVLTTWTDADHIQAVSETPYIYVPYSADVLTQSACSTLANYVQNGGRLVLEATSGFWQDGSGRANVLFTRLGLPEIDPHAQIEVNGASTFEGAPLAFRTAPWHPPVETQPTPWLQNIPRPYLRPYRSETTPPNSRVWSVYTDGSPAAYELARGRGHVLVFCGVVDWLACSGLASAVDAWGRGGHSPGGLTAPTEIIGSEYRNHGGYYLVGRRFIGHDEIDRVASSDATLPPQLPKPLSCVFQGLSAGRYHVRELLSGADLGEVSSDNLSSKGLELILKPGEGFLLEADKMPAIKCEAPSHGGDPSLSSRP